MVLYVWKLIFPLCTIFCYTAAASTSSTSTMTSMLNAIVELMTGGDEPFQPDYVSKLEKCMTDFDPQLLDAQEKFWEGTVRYFTLGGVGDDTWGSGIGSSEDNVTRITFNNMLIYEPCNYAASVAYYHGLTELCARQKYGPKLNLPKETVAAIAKSFAFIASGSAFGHASNTLLALEQDEVAVSFILFALQQAIASQLTVNTTFLVNLDTTARPQSAVQFIDTIRDVYINYPVEEWTQQIYTGNDIPDYHKIVDTLLTTITAVVFPNHVPDFLKVAIGVFNTPQDVRTFLIEDYAPAIIKATAGLKISETDTARLVKQYKGAALKLLYSNIWQEKSISLNEYISQPIVRKIGTYATPHVNQFADSFSMHYYNETKFQMAEDVYPGFKRCSDSQPHALFLYEFATALIDFVLITDDIYGVLKSLNESA